MEISILDKQPDLNGIVEKFGLGADLRKLNSLSAEGWVAELRTWIPSDITSIRNLRDWTDKQRIIALRRLALKNLPITDAGTQSHWCHMRMLCINYGSLLKMLNAADMLNG